VEIIEEFDVWRKIRDSEGTSGWVHKAMLDSRRSVLLKGNQPSVLRAEPSDSANAVLKAAPGVQAKLAECSKDWCRVQVQSRKGWLRKKMLWGVYAKEEIK
jgi:SH3-like domain-containing protein